MSTLESLFSAEKQSTGTRNAAPIRLLVPLVAGLILAEVAADTLVSRMQLRSHWLEMLVDAGILILLISPLLFFQYLYTLEQEIERRDRSQQLLLNLVENIPLGIWIIDAAGKILHNNQASQRIWGKSPLVGPEGYEKFKAWWLDSGKPVLSGEWAVNQALKTGEQACDQEFEIESFDGDRRFIINSAVPILSGSAVQGAIVVNQDITVRKLAEKELEKSKALYQAAFQILPVGAWITDADGKIIYGNPAGQRIWAGVHYVGIEQFGMFKGWWLKNGKLIEPDEWAVSRAVQFGETSIEEEIEIECFDGTHKIILNSAIPVLDGQGRRTGVFVVNQDITQRKRRESDLASAKELVESAFDSIDVNIAHLDCRFNILRVNRAYAESAGHPVEYFTGKNHFELYPDAENQAIFQKVVDTGEPYSVLAKPFEYPDYPERGVTYWNWRLQPVHAADGAIQSVVLSLLDVTERKKFELRLEKQHYELVSLSQAEQKQRRLAETLNAVSLALSKTLDLPTVLNTMLDHAARLVPAEVSFVLFAESDKELALQSVRGDLEDSALVLLPEKNFERSAYPCFRQVLDSQASLLVRDTQQNPDWVSFLLPDVVRSWLGIPIVENGRSIGLLSLSSRRLDAFADEHIQLANAIVTQAAVAIQNAWLFEQVRSGHDRLQMLSRRLVEIQESERRYIARELHDEASQSLTALMFGLSLLEQENQDPGSLQNQVEGLKKLTNQVLEDLHRLAVDLRPASLDYTGLLPALEQLVDRANARYSMQVRMKMLGFGPEQSLPDDLGSALYRIVQEALTNAARHSQAKNVDLIIERRPQTIHLIVEDDGTGFDLKEVRKEGRLGLLGIQERAHMLGGTFDIESRSGCGTSLIVEVPYGN